MYRFAFRGRWLVGLLLVLLAAAVCVRLGIWQLDRREQRLEHNDLVTSRGDLPVATLDELLAGPGDPADGDTAAEAAEHRRVEVTGRYDPEHEVLVLARSLAGTPGMHVVTPLVVAEGEAVLVNRGFVPLTDPEAPVPGEAKPPAGPVDLVGTFRAPESGGRFLPAEGAGATGTLGHVTRVDVERLASELPYSLVPGYVRIEAERPERAALPVPLPPSELGEGPHLGYAVQWFSFAAAFLVGWPLLLRHTARQRRRGSDRPLVVDGGSPNGPATHPDRESAEGARGPGAGNGATSGASAGPRRGGSSRR